MICFFILKIKQMGFLVAADFEKAFDSVDHEFLFNILELFGFGHSFCLWVKVLYTDITSCVMNGGYSTGYFDIKRGCKAGRSSLTLFVFISHGNIST